MAIALKASNIVEGQEKAAIICEIREEPAHGRDAHRLRRHPDDRYAPRLPAAEDMLERWAAFANNQRLYATAPHSRTSLDC